MHRRFLVRKCSAVGIILLFVGTCVIPTTSKPIIPTEDLSSSPGVFFGLQSHINVSWYKNHKHNVPFGGAVSFPLNITYWLSQGIFGRFLRLFIKGRQATVHLQLKEHPSWCTAIFSQGTSFFIISDTPQTKYVYLTVALDSYAPPGYFKINIGASVHSIKGPYGMITFVQPVSYSRSLKLYAGYDLRISVLPDSDSMNVTPGNISELGINITNLGDSRTLVKAEITDQPSGDWQMGITPEIIVDINMTNKAYLTVRPPSNFTGTENITITFTPYRADNLTQQGDPVNITIVVRSI
ncbi:MAG: hypothetical protein JW840_00395 [Candidatus Thermoplasmatota archaeon]|nr:hypothetical protein [Candidatus Thermoplasmatota archaeon]